MTGLTMDILAPRHSAEVTITRYWANKLSIEEGVVTCHVLGLFQCVDGDDCAYPVFVCELDDGRVINVDTLDVKFTDTEGGVLK